MVTISSGAIFLICVLCIAFGGLLNAIINEWVDEHFAKKIITIDLTSKYGSGNEPDLKACDRLFDNEK